MQITVLDLAVFACKTVLVMLFLFVAFRLLGKRQVAQMNLYDLVMIMAVANAVQNAMTGGRGNLSVGLVTSATVILIAWFATRLFIHAPKLEERCIGTPTVILNHGRVLRKQLYRERVSPEELMAAIRGHGLQHANQVELAVIEVDGSISIVPKNEAGKGG